MVLHKVHTNPSIFNHSQSTTYRIDTVDLPQEVNVSHNNNATGSLWPLHAWTPSEGYGKQQVPHLNPEPRRSGSQTERSQVSRSSNRGKMDAVAHMGAHTVAQLAAIRILTYHTTSQKSRIHTK
jgi:hypothetical protein